MNMDVAKNELFAPVMSIVPYDSVDEMVNLLNRSRFGLGAGVYGETKAECQRVAGLLQCGMVAINEYVELPFCLSILLMGSFVRCVWQSNDQANVKGVFYLNQAAPFGGVKASGHGRFGQ